MIYPRLVVSDLNKTEILHLSTSKESPAREAVRYQADRLLAAGLASRVTRCVCVHSVPASELVERSRTIKNA